MSLPSKSLSLLGLLLAAALISVALAQDGQKQSDAVPAEPEKPVAYPLTTCVVSGEKLGSMGDPFVFNYEGREIKFCCRSCLRKFQKDPAAFLKKIEEADSASKDSVTGQADAESCSRPKSCCGN
jgi:YHS domain-containing protein